MGIRLTHPDYLDLKSRIRENPKDFVAIVGSGLSRPAGIESWQGLRSLLISEAMQRVDDRPEDERLGYLNQVKRAENQTDLWRSFSDLKSLLNRTAYDRVITNALTLEDRSLIPESYRLLWRLGVRGLITFNLDNCALDAHADVLRSVPDQATGKEHSKYSQFLQGTQTFVFQPHGNVRTPTTWVFTAQERDSLLSFPPYIDFMKSVYASRHLLILGLGPEDFAFRYVVQRCLGESGATAGHHYIFLASQDPSHAKELAEKSISVITYVPEDATLHTEIADALADMLGFVPSDSIPHSIYMGDVSEGATLPSDDELIHLPINESRRKLSKAIAAIIPPGSSPTVDDIDRLHAFYSDHIRPIHMAWLVEPDTEQNELYGYKITERLGHGAFGQVYKAVNVETKSVAAVKVLLQEVRRMPEFLNSFRRGVHSMRILTERNLKRMVKILAAHEVPACVFMEYVDGPTLREAVEWGHLDALHECLEVLIQVGEAVHSAHNLPEKVLHRDLKPDNVILKGRFDTTESIDVVVLDFDLSWYVGASELSVAHSARTLGYAAPEQTATGKKAGVSTRHIAVDVFGLGMLAYYVLTATDPRPNDHRLPSFRNSVAKKISDRFRPKWHCLSGFLADTIANSTADIQSERAALSSVLDSLRAALDMTMEDRMSSGNPLVLQEIAARLEPLGRPDTADYGRKVVVTSPDPSKYSSLTMVDDGKSIAIEFVLSKVRHEAEFRRVMKYLPAVKEKAASKLKGSLFQDVRPEIGQSRVDIYARLPLPDQVPLSFIEKVVKPLEEAKIELNFQQ